MVCKFSKSAAHFIKSADKNTKQRIKRGIEGLMNNPPIGDIKPMKDWLPPSFRLRIGGYRIIFSYREATDGTKILYVQDIGSRGDIYR